MEGTVEKRGKIIVAGGSGFIGQSLIAHLKNLYSEIVVLSRGPAGGDGVVEYLKWDGKTVESNWVKWINGADAIVNVTGRSVDCVKTEKNKHIILESRVDSVNALAQACQQVNNPPKVWIQSATAHIYGDTQDEMIDESSPLGTIGMAPDVGKKWEAAINDADLPNTRKVILRISFVLGRHGGPLKILARLARFGLGGRIGSGKHYMSWIHEDDLNQIILRAIDNQSMHGTYVVTSPNPVTNDEFARLLRKAVGRPWSPPVPELMVRLGAAILRTDPELAIYGRRCVPTKLLREGFVFRYPQLESALKDLLS